MEEAKIKTAKTLQELSALLKAVRLVRWQRPQQLVLVGDPQAKIFLLGEAPGAKEDELGRPFVGRAGELLTALLAEAGITREEVYITGSCKCRPPKNRNPYKKELAACLPIVKQQLAIIRPQVVVCLGLVAVHNLLILKHVWQMCAANGLTVPAIAFILLITRQPFCGHSSPPF